MKEGQAKQDEGLKVALDCGNGAAAGIAGEAYRRLGAEVREINCQPNGRNINDGCGSTHPEQLQQIVVDAQADAGLAFDGDADRVLAVDHTGALVDGDHMMAICAIAWSLLNKEPAAPSVPSVCRLIRPASSLLLIGGQ